MKKQLIKEITDINKLIKNEQKNKSELDLKLDSLEQEINSIEDKFKSQTKDINIYESYPKISKLEKLYETSLRKNREKIFIQYNLSTFQKENETKLKNLQKKIHELIEKENKNQNLIEKKIEELGNEFSKAERQIYNPTRNDVIAYDFKNKFRNRIHASVKRRDEKNKIKKRRNYKTTRK